MEKSARLLAAAILILMCTGCSRLMLEQRSFIRDIFVSQSAGTIQVGLWQEEPDKLTVGEGKTLTEAFYDAEDQLDGKPFYGQNQRIILEEQLPWQIINECVDTFIADTPQMPNVTLWLSKEIPEEKKCGAFLKELTGMEDSYDLSANLYELTRRGEIILLPCTDGETLLAAAKTKDRLLEWKEPYSDLALLLAQEAKGLSVVLETEEGRILVESPSCALGMEHNEGRPVLRLLLRDCTWETLDRKRELSKPEMETVLDREVQNFLNELWYHGIDPFLMEIRLKNSDPMSSVLWKSGKNNITFKSEIGSD